MAKAKRFSVNPLLKPSKKNNWEKEAVFNPSVIKEGNSYKMLYRAMGTEQIYHQKNISLNTIGLAQSTNGMNFTGRKKFIEPEHLWELYGCEDPRMTKFKDKYYIFYTALSDYPHSAEGIKVGVAITKDFKKVEEKHQVTHFNSKAMALFPEKVDGKLTVILTADPDTKPPKIAIAYLNDFEQMWSKDYWDRWKENVDDYTLNLRRDSNDHVEVGAPPLKTKQGWLLIYSYIKNYLNPPPIFGIEAVLLDLENPLKILGRSTEPLLVPKKDYELNGKVPNIVFPTSAVTDDNILKIYYGASDNYICGAEVELDKLLDEMLDAGKEPVKLEKYKGNPIISPVPGSTWESKFTFNPAAIYEGGKVHIVYRAMNDDNKSSLGYASSMNGLRIDERLPEPIYNSREDTEKHINPIYHSCEDPRLTILGDKVYMCYTAYDGKTVTVIALSSIKIDDFLNRNWKWETPRVISNPKIDDKNACIFPEKVNGKYIFLHRLEHKIWLDSFDDLNFKKGRWLAGDVLMNPREESWDSEKIGIAGPPIKTSEGWLLVFHGLSKHDRKYRLSAALLDLSDPMKVLSRLPYPIIEPDKPYENVGDRPGTIFACGNVIIKDKLYVYYGAADQVVAVATTQVSDLMDALKKQAVD